MVLGGSVWFWSGLEGFWVVLVWSGRVLGGSGLVWKGSRWFWSGLEGFWSGLDGFWAEGEAAVFKNINPLNQKPSVPQTSQFYKKKFPDFVKKKS